MRVVAVMRFCPSACGHNRFAEPANFWKIHARWSASAWQVSSHGRVQNSVGRVSFGSPRGGYRAVQIEGQSYYVHRLVAAAFIVAATPARWQVNHVDGDRSNNHFSNLEYVSPAENVRHSFSKGCRKLPATKTGNAVQWRQLGEGNWSLCPTQSEAARKLGVSKSSITSCCSGEQGKARGLGIRYEIRRAKLEPDLQACEDWKPAVLPGSAYPIPDLMVSSRGRVWSTSWRHSYVTQGSLCNNGYCVVHKAGRRYYVHRLIAAAFLGHPRSPQLVVNHVDSDRANNRVQNLEYVTRSQNAIHAFSKGRKSTGNPKPVQLRMLTPEGPWIDFESIRAASLHTGLSRHKINRLCEGLPTSCASWEFRHKEAEDFEGEVWRPVVLEGARAPLK